MRTYHTRYRVFFKKYVLVFLIMSFAAIGLAQFGGGDGTEQSPWVIERPEHLDAIRDYLGEEHSDKYYIQRDNINLDVPPWNEGEGWVPIGDNNNSFYGTYNGNGHIIRGMTINRDSNYQGLFGYTYGAAISNLGLKDVNIIADRYVGGITGYQREGEIKGCYVTGTITASNDIGGIAGYMRYENPVISDRLYAV